MTELSKRVALKATPLLTVFLGMLLVSILQAEAAVIRDLRFGDNKDYMRMVMEFDRPLNPAPSFSVHRNTLQVTLAGITSNLPERQSGEYHADIINLEVSQMSDATRIDAAFSFDPADVKTFTLTDPHRFIIDAYRPISSAAARLPVEESRHMALIEEAVFLPEPYREPEKPLPTGGSASIDEAPVRTGGSAEDSGRNRFQQQLIAALIVVTSIIVVLLIFLIWMNGGRKHPARPSWVHDLPPARDREIESIDSAIGEHLKNHEPR